MEWDEATRTLLERALNESEVVGVRLDPSGAHVDVPLQVNALPEVGPLLKDGRRVLRLTEPGELRFLVRQDPVGEPLAQQPAIPLADEAAVEELFESLLWSGAIYGWRFVDAPDLTRDWPIGPSLVVPTRAAAAPHSFYWFNECGIQLDDGPSGFVLEGTITFADLLVLDADGLEIPIETFIADGVRYWDAFFANDERLSVAAQQDAQRDAPRWQAWSFRDAGRS